MMNIDEIRAILPHRTPFLLIDRIEEMDDCSVHARKCVSTNEPYFAGHFPQHQVMPGVLIAEALAQAGAVLLLSQPENKGKIAYFAGIDHMRFKKQVIPGDVLDLYAKLGKARGNIVFADVKAECEGKTVCSGQILCAIGDARA